MSPARGEIMASRWAVVMRGGRKPRAVLARSSSAAALGETLLTPTLVPLSVICELVIDDVPDHLATRPEVPVPLSGDEAASAILKVRATKGEVMPVPLS